MLNRHLSHFREEVAFLFNNMGKDCGYYFSDGSLKIISVKNYQGA